MTWGATAMQSFTMPISQDDYHQVLRVLADAMRRFPDNYRLPQRAGEIYALRLTSDDPAELRRYKQEGARLLSKAIHMPNAPKRLGTLVAHLRSELGQRDLAIRDLRELILYTSDGATRRVLVDKLAKLTSGRSETIDCGSRVEARRFDEAWHRDRPEFRPSDYAVIGPRVPASIQIPRRSTPRTTSCSSRSSRCPRWPTESGNFRWLRRKAGDKLRHTSAVLGGNRRRRRRPGHVIPDSCGTATLVRALFMGMPWPQPSGLADGERSRSSSS